MNLLKILTKVGNNPLVKMIPGASQVSAVLDVVNAVLPDKVDENSTGEEIIEQIDKLPVQEKTILLSKQLDVEIAEINANVQIQQALAEVDKAGASTRPEIAKQMANTVQWTVLISVSTLLIAVIFDRQDIVVALTQAWPLILAMIATPTVLLRAYFGLRTKEKESRYATANGHPPPSGGIGALIGAIKGK